jgi:hypothetical protein
MKMLTGTGSTESSVDFGLQLGGFGPYKCCLPWYNTKHSVMQKLLVNTPLAFRASVLRGNVCYHIASRVT